MKLLTKEIERKLRANHKATIEAGINKPDHKPAVKYFSPVGAATWLITEIDQDNIMFGLCDLGMGYPELGYVSLEELADIKFMGGRLGIERDLYSKFTEPLSHYVSEASRVGYIKA